jgi:hypothetical protein
VKLEVSRVRSTREVSKRSFESLLQMVSILLVYGDAGQDEDRATAMGAGAI